MIRQTLRHLHMGCGESLAITPFECMEEKSKKAQKQGAKRCKKSQKTNVADDTKGAE